MVKAGRSEDIAAFIRTVIGAEVDALALLNGDASTRQYWRAQCAGGCYIVMDAHHDACTVGKFAAITAALKQHDCPVPQIYGVDDDLGLLLQQDFGDDWLLYGLERGEQGLLDEALTLLARWQTLPQNVIAAMPLYDEAVLMREVRLFAEWFLPFVGVAANDALMVEMTVLAQAIAKHPQVCVHRDYHSRNIMRLRDGGLGLLDYQDIIWGSAAYDVISLTRDCYIRHDADEAATLEREFGQASVPGVAPSLWAQYCNEAALQRHLKVLGIFVRLSQRDGKHGYLADLPLVLEYARAEAEVLGGYPVMLNLLNRSRSGLQERVS